MGNTIKQEDVLIKIKNREYVTAPELAAINTPELPEEVFDKHVNPKSGIEYKRTINNDKFKEWLQSTTNARSIDQRFINGTSAQSNLIQGIKTIDNKMETDDQGVVRTGLIWHDGSNFYPISLVGNEQIIEMKQALKGALKHSLKPNTTSQFAKIDLSSSVEFNKIDF